MHLRAIKVRGFKSFPDPVEVRLDRGVGVIVGPNGSGKSNVADAIRWAAGSLSPNELRAEKPDDVLFAGGAGRGPSDFCEVELLFDNQDGAGDFEYSELAIARRLHRGGEGQYLVNRTPVRRIDLVELLADLGLGQGMHSIIGQGKVEAILASRPEERRALIEEAAGLGRFKARRHRAELKLARVAVQVERARDLEDEVRKRLRPLALQATAAERAEKLRHELARLRARLAQLDLEALDGRLADADDRKGAAALVRRAAEEKLEAVLAERGGAEEELADAAGRREQAMQALYRLRSAAERLGIRRESTTSLLEQVRTELAAAESDAGDPGAETAGLEQASHGAAEVARVAAVERETRFERARRALARLLGAERAVQASAQERLDVVLAERTQIEETLTGAAGEREAALSVSYELRSRAARLAVQRESAVRLIARLRVGARGGRGRRRTRRSVAGGTGAGRAARACCRARRGARARHARRAHAHRARAARDTRALARGARGNPAGRACARGAGRAARVVDAQRRAGDGAGGRRRARSARVRARRRRREVRARAARARGRGRARLAARARGPRSARPRRRAARRREGQLLSCRCPAVTRDGYGYDPQRGELWFAGETAEAVLLELDSRRAALAEEARGLAEQAQFAEREADAAEERAEAAETAFAAAAPRLRLRRADEQTLRSLVAAARRLERALDSLDRAVDRVEAPLRTRGEAGSARTAELGATLRALGERESALRRELATATEGASAAERDLVRLGGATTADDSGGEIDALRTEAHALVAAADAAATEAAAAGELARAAEAARIDAAVRAGRRRARPHELARVLSGAERLDETLAAAAVAAARFETPLRARVDAGATRTGELGEELRRLGAAEVELRQELSAASERASAIDVEVARIETEADEARRRLEHANADEPAEGDDRDELAERIDRLERRRESLGQVNPLAKEEHDAEKTRLDELATQRADLEQSLTELEKLSAELKETVETRFTETFDAVQRHFHEVAATLFPGGEGRLQLTMPEDDEENPGIEVELRPAGKKVQRLSLLSGGEKALGAISFLFALFLARPCPFYLLDEVEAALDDTNIGRFVELLRDYADRAQFVVITHQKRTMEAADVLYGVTMGGDGISQIVSRRLPREDAEAVSAA